MKKIFCAFALLALAAGSALAAPSVSLHASNVGITDFSYSVSGSRIDIWEEWTLSGPGMLQVGSLCQFQNYTIVKHITNNTGADWDHFANELLDPAGDGNDAGDNDPQSWVPAGFSHSNENDGLSFAQGSGIARTSAALSHTVIDELAGRDYIDFYGGQVSGDGGTDVIQFGIRDNFYNQPFVLAQRPNEYTNPPVPEPATLVLFGLGLAGVALRKRFVK